MSAQNWKQIAEREYARLAAAGYHTGQIRNLMRAAEGRFLELEMSTGELSELSTLTATLAEEFNPGAAIMIVRETHKHAGKAEERKRRRISHRGTENTERIKMNQRWGETPSSPE
jgi:D-mannonate dehydratase